MRFFAQLGLLLPVAVATGALTDAVPDGPARALFWGVTFVAAFTLGEWFVRRWPKEGSDG